jgi:hypothetical protein
MLVPLAVFVMVTTSTCRVPHALHKEHVCYARCTGVAGFGGPLAPAKEQSALCCDTWVTLSSVCSDIAFAPTLTEACEGGHQPLLLCHCGGQGEGEPQCQGCLLGAQPTSHHLQHNRHGTGTPNKRIKELLRTAGRSEECHRRIQLCCSGNHRTMLRYAHILSTCLKEAAVQASQPYSYCASVSTWESMKVYCGRQPGCKHALWRFHACRPLHRCHPYMVI